MRSSRRSFRVVARALTVSLSLTLVTAMSAPVALAAGSPSVELPTITPVPVTGQPQGPLPPDDTSSRLVRGNQTPSTGAQEGGGSFKTTPLAPSGSWDVSQQTGDFSWSYPLRVPPSPGGFQPSLGLSYRSSAVDGRTSATNNQASWVGDGWDLGAGFIERTYGGCADDVEGGVAPPQVGDLCWRSDNATASYPGGGGMLIRVGDTAVWKQKSDNGAKIERLNGVANGDEGRDGTEGREGGEHWKITTVDGTQYFFGSRPEAQSTWTVPVFGDDANEQCHGATFDTSSCNQAWRWNLDKTIDPRGNVILYGYETETNSYGRNLKDEAVSYVRAGTLKWVEYGLRDDVNAPASGRVDFTLTDRCVIGSDCQLGKKENWPDTLLDERCVASTCKDHYSPTFWSTKKLSKVTTKVWRGTIHVPVDSWTLEHEFVNTGGGSAEKPSLWLKSIAHTGHVNGSITLPPVSFHGKMLANRVELANTPGPLMRYRISAVVSEAGGVTSVNYEKPDCREGSMPDKPESNTLRCYPATWKKKDFVETTDYFHKYVVASVVTSDRFGLANTQQVSYEYLGGAAWHFNQSEFTKEEKKTWDEFRGYGKVRVRTGRPEDTSGPITMSEQRFYRGMDGNKGSVGPVEFTDSEGGLRRDFDWLQGFSYEARTHLGESETVVSKTISTPKWSGPTATRGQYEAYVVNSGVSTAYTALESGGWRTTKTENTFDELGQLTKVNDLGDTTTAADDRCSKTTYARNPGKWMMSYPSQQETVAVNCDATPSFPDDALADGRVAYDGQDFGAAPVLGNVTKQDVADQRPASDPIYTTKGSATYDKYGRPLTITNALGTETKIAYTPATGGPVTETVVTNALGHATTLTVEPAWGVPTKSVDPNRRITEGTFDALGRATEVWLPNRKRVNNTDGSTKFSYQVRNDAPTVVSQTSLGPNLNYVTSNTLYDGLYRVRQVQVPTDGGRLLTDTRYDSHGRVDMSTQPFYNDKPVDTSLWVASAADVPGTVYSRFDGANRPVKSMFYGGAQKKWETVTAYGGDRMHVTPPQGGTPTTTITDARGRTTELRQYKAATPTGDFDATKYTYTASGQLASTEDPSGNTWRWTYDLQGRKVKSEDVDKGTSSSVYSPAGQLLSTVDARGETLAYSYDVLGRTTQVKDVRTDLLTQEFTYDTALSGKGQSASATRFVNGRPYISRITAYTSLYKPVRSEVVIPEAEGRLEGTYETNFGYKDDGTLAQEEYSAVPAAGMPSELVAHEFDDLRRPTRTIGGVGQGINKFASATSFTKYGEVQRIELGDVGKRAWLSSYYDVNSRRLTRQIVDAEVSAPMQADVNYSYDDAGNVKSVVDAPREQAADVQCFEYDYLRRLSEAWTPSVSAGCGAERSAGGLSGPAPYWQSFGYDKSGNRTSEVAHAGAGDTTRTYDYPVPGSAQAHTVKSVTTAGVDGAKSESFGYDAAGNTTSRPGQVLEWDAEGRLVKVTEGSKVSSFVYGADGSRLLRRDPEATTLYLPGQEVRLAAGASAPTVTRYYSHAGKTIAMREGKIKLTWLAADHQGTSQIAIDVSSMTTTRRRQLPFGGARGPVLPVGFPGEKGFVGGTNDTSTGLVHIGARQYDAALGKFLSVDPIMDIGNPQQWNAYAYGDNSPVTVSDPTGLIGARCADGDCSINKAGQRPAPRPGSDAPGGVAVMPAKNPGMSLTPWAVQGGIRKGAVAAYQGVVDTAKFVGPCLAGSGADLVKCGQNVQAAGNALTAVAMDPGGAAVAMVDATIAPVVEASNRGDYGEALGLGLFAVAEIAVGTKGLSGLKGLRALEKACGPNSFTGATLVLMADGSSKPIKDVKVGDKVLATDPVTDATEAREVTDVIVGDGVKQLVDIEVRTDAGVDTLIATDEHPFWIEDQGRWVDAGHLQVDQRLFSTSGVAAMVIGVWAHTEVRKVYNFTVEGIHTYYVMASKTPVLVHNSCGEIALGKQKVDGDPDALDIFAMDRSAASYKDWPGSSPWYKQLQGFIADGTTRIHVNLDGIDDPISYAKSGAAVDPTDVGGRGFTRWEMNQLSNSPDAWGRVSWYRGGRKVDNPFE